ncbi:biotin carboxylase N-terminal domain-containing protein [uncultured Nocardioides sp.]|uniref:acetyl/propionyl/methylcrotonyl-CoA carboxylase subunit alpha n=1 Tax=uncultured Nocardioides sp. TaxID=198441 RepID=UPI00260D4967|nr:biotin carboxylase N-terminal domain-containing protein [uncultured Nocardioides sp.]
MTTLLVANRGEIALRVFRTASAMGMRTVAVHTDLDASAPHVRGADAAVRVDSYLDVDDVVRAARESGADLVHPGYGFLSERAAFARALDDAGITLVGPSADVMDAMGRKDHARAIAERAGVPVVPSYDVERPEAMTFPVLVKAAAGGGGKGMRVVRSAGEYDEALAAARREAAAGFGDDTMLVERYVERGRHVEVQVVGDTHGTVIHCFERDCSTQRRHQKVLEEAPAPTLTPEQRTEITEAGARLAREVGYVGAGTVEFLLDADTGEFFFLEMNTRLQVEHPVTEMVTGLDLVALQLRVALGEPLGLAQDDVTLTGHAVEARVYAEDSWAGFLPQAGTATLVRWPSGEGVRVDHALESGQVVPTAYDPMLGKVVAAGADREEARARLLDALDGTGVLGLTTNAGFLRALVATDAFRDATIDTAWLDRTTLEPPTADVARTAAAWVSAMLAAHASPPGPFAADGFRAGGPAAPTLVDLDHVVAVDRAAGTVDGVPVTQVSAADHVLELRVDGEPVRSVVNVQPHEVEATHRGQRWVLTPPDPAAGDAVDVAGGTVLAPMPGTVVDVRVAEGDAVTEGQVLGTMEAMKMELALKAPYDGTVTAVGASAGAQVPMGHELFVVEGAEEA